MTSPSPLPLATKSFLNVRHATGHDVARRSCRFVRARLGIRALIAADMRAICPSVKQFCAVLKMTFRLQPWQTASVVVIVATQSP
jgi:hypothetical protein